MQTGFLVKSLLAEYFLRKVLAPVRASARWARPIREKDIAFCVALDNGEVELVGVGKSLFVDFASANDEDFVLEISLRKGSTAF